ncbi:uncharacterized protein BX663DRAFT_493446 [Cokeromyces recurvatus]|uniref:uncharacterized protein n=1 Tax=Cokeromyces recurvatus TaxID=90255 RepID=UPI00221F058A|nr:uncharacterized protein BX663DRAFT_493446 [Cokeromyces recurvatus]KAI7908224.1 hypothetical protein BX663DRAFT_493446 [Cokeromyces recurvatus]
MGFCIYCNQKVYSSTTCPKCYRTISMDKSSTNNSTTSKINSVFLNQKRLNQMTDKWQDTYGKKAIFNTELDSSVSPLKTRQHRTIPQFNTVESSKTKSKDDNMKSCAICQRKQNSWTDLNNFSIHNSVFYCKPCLAKKLACPGCEKAVNRTDIQTFFNQQMWHTSCFKCHHCNTPLKTMLASVDADGKPCCRTCHLKNNSTTPVPGTPSLSTPTLKSSHSTMTSKDDNPYFKYQRTRTSSMLSPSTTLSQKDLESFKDVNDKASSPKLETSANKIIAVEDKKEESSSKKPKEVKRRKKVPKRICKECGQHVSKRDYRGLRVQTGEVFCFHSYCLHCAKCNEQFNTLEFCTDGEKFYHVECPDKSDSKSLSSTPISRRQSNTLSEEDEAFPPTPPPHTTYFDIPSINPISLSFPDSEDLINKKKYSEMDQPSTTILCSTCSKPVTDTCLELANQFYHKECLLCAGCNQTVPTDRKLVKYQDKLYCDSCTQKTKKKAATSDLLLTKRTSTITSPSDIFKSRKKVLPRLGGVRTCARCNESMPFSDTQPGPNASRWHKKCLRCATCNKQMDSDAHMTVNEETGLCLVHCRDCLDDTPKPRFVR